MLLLPGCKPTTEIGDTIVNATDPASEAVTLTSQGWSAFEARRYPDAVSLFRQAASRNDRYSDAYNGIGWSYARMDSLHASLRAFDIALALEPEFNDAYAGRSFVSLALGEYADAVAAVWAVEGSGAKFYAFRHDARITLDDLLLVKARSYFLLRNYQAAQTVIDRLDPENRLDPSSPTYVEDLALVIESLASRV
jgi:tetratricopeptide (TPR) repeat protein